MTEFEGKNFVLGIENALEIRGDEAAVRQLMTILCDNAVKYSLMPGEIGFSLHRSRSKNRWKIVLEVSNLCEQAVNETTLSRLFDRFYRADASRTKESGKSSYGIDLAIAKAIVEKYNGKISVKQDKGKRITFKVIM